MFQLAHVSFTLTLSPFVPLYACLITGYLFTSCTTIQMAPSATTSRFYSSSVSLFKPLCHAMSSPSPLMSFYLALRPCNSWCVPVRERPCLRSSVAHQPPYLLYRDSPGGLSPRYLLSASGLAIYDQQNATMQNSKTSEIHNIFWFPPVRITLLSLLVSQHISEHKRIGLGGAVQYRQGCLVSGRAPQVRRPEIDASFAIAGRPGSFAWRLKLAVHARRML